MNENDREISGVMTSTVHCIFSEALSNARNLAAKLLGEEPQDLEECQSKQINDKHHTLDRRCQHVHD